MSVIVKIGKTSYEFKALIDANTARYVYADSENQDDFETKLKQSEVDFVKSSHVYNDA